MKPFNRVQKWAWAHLKMLSTKCLEIIYLIYTYKKDLALNYPQWLICHKTKPNQWIKTGFLPNCGCVHTIVWMHHLETNKKHREKAKWKLFKNAVCCFDQILETTFCKTAAVQLLTFHLKSHPSKTKKTCRTLLKK